MDFKCKNTKFSLYSIIIRVNYRSSHPHEESGLLMLIMILVYLGKTNYL